MKALVYTEYGPPDVPRLTDVGESVPGDYDVRVEVVAASVNASDWEFLTGRPLYTRMWGLRKPKRPILGSDIAGISRGAANGSSAAG